jgi:osmotically-inducible protein OsmY
MLSLRTVDGILRASLLLALLSGCTTLSSDPRARTTGAYIDDGAIESLVTRAIRSSDPEFESAHLVVVSYNALVLLAGQVETEALQEKATQVASSLAKVRGVHSELEVGGPTSLMARSNDAWLTSKVKSKLIANKRLQGSRIKVVTENGVVYLMGLIPREEGDEAAETARTVYGVQKIVKVFEYL